MRTFGRLLAFVQMHQVDVDYRSISAGIQEHLVGKVRSSDHSGPGESFLLDPVEFGPLRNLSCVHREAEGCNTGWRSKDAVANHGCPNDGLQKMLVSRAGKEGKKTHSYSICSNYEVCVVARTSL
jgi:hypothetical protein